MHDEKDPDVGADDQIGLGPRVPAEDVVLELGEDAGRLPRGELGRAGLELVEAGGDLAVEDRFQFQGLAQFHEGVLMRYVAF